MVVKSGTEQKVMLPVDFDMVSSAPDKISLHYIGKLWGDLYLEVMRLIFIQLALDQDCEDCRYEQLVADVSMDMVFNIQKNVVRPTAYIKAKLKRGGCVSGRVFIQAERDEIRAVLDRFFDLGGNGVDAAYLPHFKEKYKMWVSSKNF